MPGGSFPSGHPSWGLLPLSLSSPSLLSAPLSLAPLRPTPYRHHRLPLPCLIGPPLLLPLLAVCQSAPLANLPRLPPTPDLAQLHPPAYRQEPLSFRTSATSVDAPRQCRSVRRLPVSVVFSAVTHQTLAMALLLLALALA